MAAVRSEKEGAGGRILRLSDGMVLIDDPHHHAPGHDHALCETDDEQVHRH